MQRSRSIITEQDEALDFLDALVAQNERGPDPWRLNRDDDRFVGLVAGIVVFRVSMDKVEAAFKLNQNKTADDQASVIEHLSRSDRPSDREVADLMKQGTPRP